MYHPVFFIAVGLLSLGLLFAACGGDGNSDSHDTPAASEVAPTSTAAPPAGGDTYTVTLSGALQGTEWHTGDEGSGVSCVVQDGEFGGGVYGNLAGATYALNIRQTVYGAGSYTFPVAAPGDDTPNAQMTTASNSTAQWNLGPQSGTAGTITLSIGSDDLLTISIDGDFSDINAGDPVHVVATITCAPQVG